MLSTRVAARRLAFTAYVIAPGGGGTNVVLVNKDATNALYASVDAGIPVASATSELLTAPSLDARTGVTFRGAEVTPAGAWAPGTPDALATHGNDVTVGVPPDSAVLIRTR